MEKLASQLVTETDTSDSNCKRRNMSKVIVDKCNRKALYEDLRGYVVTRWSCAYIGEGNQKIYHLLLNM